MASHSKRSRAHSQALQIQGVLLAAILAPTTKPSDLAALARAWATVQESVRVIRGVPLPGQYRPDLDTKQLERAILRARKRSAIDLVPAQIAGSSGPIEIGPGTPAEPEPAKAEPGTDGAGQGISSSQQGVGAG